MTNTLFVTEDTTVEEILEYIEWVVQHPTIVETEAGSKTVWNFSSHDINHAGLNLEYKEEDAFVIPFQVTSTWGFMFALLPDDIQRAENLIWRKNERAYFAYRQFYRDISPERAEQFRYAMARQVSEEVEPHDG